MLLQSDAWLKHAFWGEQHVSNMSSIECITVAAQFTGLLLNEVPLLYMYNRCLVSLVTQTFMPNIVLLESGDVVSYLFYDHQSDEAYAGSINLIF